MENQAELSHKEFMISNEHQISIGLKTLQLLFISNAGAIVAFLGFLSHKACEKLPPIWFWGVMSFVIGLIFVLVAYTFAYFHQMTITNKYRNEYHYHKSLENYNIYMQKQKKERDYLKVLNTYLEKMKEIISQPFSDCLFMWAVIFAILSALLFILGTVLILNGFYPSPAT